MPNTTSSTASSTPAGASSWSPNSPLGPAVSAARLADAATSGYRELRARVARHPHTSTETLAALAGDPDPLVRLAVARRADLALPLRRTLCRDEHEAVRRVARGTRPLRKHELAA